MHLAEGGFSGASASAHRLYGTAVGVATVAVWLLATRWADLYERIGLAAGVLLVVLVALAGHYGGNLTHGSTYLLEHAPAPLRALAGVERRPPVTDLALADPYHDIVRPMLRARCGTCHNDDKRNGGFSMAEHASTLAGGDTGRAIVSGDSAASELYRRVTLPADHEEFMPAEGKTPLTAEQVEVLRWWIDAGAPVDTTLGAVEVAPQIEPLLKAAAGLGGVPQPGLAAEAVSADPELVARLEAAGFIVRQVSLSDPRLIVAVSSPGRAFGPDQSAALRAAADRIVELDLQTSSLDDADLAGFDRFVELARLRLSNNRLTDLGLRQLAGLPKLTHLNLYGNAGVTDDGLAAVAEIESLGSLYLWQTGVSADGVARFRAARPHVSVDTGAAAVPTSGGGAASVAPD
jgi:hypothetical protein